MISIEGRNALLARCTANKPLDCIRVEHIDAASFVSGLSDGVSTVLWLDIDACSTTIALTRPHRP